jgi:hypothetical protein
MPVAAARAGEGTSPFDQITSLTTARPLIDKLKFVGHNLRLSVLKLRRNFSFLEDRFDEP